MNSDQNQKYPTKHVAGDVVHSLIKTAAGFIHAGEVINYIIAPPLEKRRTEWFQDLGARLGRLEKEKGISIEDLKENDEFIDIVIQATHIALRSSQTEKREALKNAIINNACGLSPDLSMQQMFMNYVDSFTIWHIKLLELFRDPVRWSQKKDHLFQQLSMGGLSHIIEAAFQELKGKRDIYDQIWKDLYSRGLVNTEGLHVTMTGSGLMSKRTTSLGEAFINYITCD